MSQNTQLTSAQQKAMNLEESICMTASAGTGKTTVLTERYLALLMEKHAKPEDILCLTFTEKAAAEMKVKVEKKVRKAHENARSDTHLEAAASSIHKSCIFTFHGFCSTVLREFSCEAGIVAGFGIMDDLDRQEYVAKTIDETLQRPPEYLFGAVQELFSYHTKGGIKDGLRKLIAFWPERREWFEEVISEPKKTFKKWCEAQEKYLRNVADVYLKNEDMQTFVSLVDPAEKPGSYNKKQAELYYSFKNAASPKALYEVLKTAVKAKARTTKDFTLDSELLDRVNACIASIGDDIDVIKKSVFLESFDDPHTKLMISIMQAFGKVAAHIYEAVEAKKEQANLLSFDDLISKTRALMDNKAVREALRKRFQYILVDEVQDNDPALTAIVKALAEKKDGTIEKNRLFIVGDVKQSIYGFKGSYPTEAWELMNGFENKVNLDVNFRTLPSVQKVINQVFEALYSEERKGENNGIVYPAVRPNRSAETGGVISLQYVPPADEDKKKKKPAKQVKAERAEPETGEPETAEDAGAAGAEGAAEGDPEVAYPAGITKDLGEALLLASWIKDTVERGTANLDKGEEQGSAGYSDIAVLYRSRTHVSDIKEAFTRYGIPFTEYKGKGFYSCQEIYDFYNVIRASVYPEDDTALYGALRSPFFGLTDAEIAQAVCWKKGDTLHAKLSASDSPAVLDALALLAEFTQAAAASPVPELLRTIIDKTGAYAVYAAMEGGDEKIANLEQFLAIAAEKSASRAVSVFAFIRMMEVCIAENLSVDEASADESGDVSGDVAPAGDADGADNAAKGAVKLMTIHASKGLEFPVTVLMYCENQYQYRDDGLVFDKSTGEKSTGEKSMGEKSAGCAHSSLTFPGEKDKLFGFISAGIKQKTLELEYGEHQRLFYVGMTRAKDYLLLVSAAKDTGAPEHSFMSYFENGFPRSAWDNADVQVIDRLVCAPQASVEGGSSLPEIPSWWVCRRCAGTAADASNASNAADASGAAEGTGGDSSSSDTPDPYILKRGSCIHEIFEGRDPETVCRKYSLMQDMETFTSYLAAFMDSDIMRDADTSWCELPLCSAAGEYRRCDRLVRKKDGSYVIVDYKSGKLSALSDALREKYVKQLTEYSEIVSPVLGEDVVPA